MIRMKTSGSSAGVDPTRVTQLSWRPRCNLVAFSAPFVGFVVEISVRIVGVCMFCSSLCLEFSV